MLVVGDLIRLSHGPKENLSRPAIDPLFRTAASGLSCPDCHCSLYEIADKRVVRFRCRSGHGYSAEALLSGQESTRESLLASIYSALLEEAALAARLTALPEEVEDAAHVTYLQQRAARLRGEAEQISAWMRTTSGLVDPDELTALADACHGDRAREGELRSG